MLTLGFQNQKGSSDIVPHDYGLNWHSSPWLYYLETVHYDGKNRYFVRDAPGLNYACDCVKQGAVFTRVKMNELSLNRSHSCTTHSQSIMKSAEITHAPDRNAQRSRS